MFHPSQADQGQHGFSVPAVVEAQSSWKDQILQNFY